MERRTPCHARDKQEQWRQRRAALQCKNHEIAVKWVEGAAPLGAVFCMTTLDDTLRAQIEALTDDAEALLVRDRFDTLDALAERRHALLARHLGFAPARPVPVVTVVGDSNALFFAGNERLRKVRYRRVGLFRREYVTRGVELLPCFRELPQKR